MKKKYKRNIEEGKDKGKKQRRKKEFMEKEENKDK